MGNPGSGNRNGYANQNGAFRIVFPGVVSVTGPLCSGRRTVEFTIKAGTTIATLKYYITEGKSEANGDVLSIAASAGTPIEAGTHRVTVPSYF